MRVNQHSFEWTEQYTQVVTIHGHTLRDICEAGMKGGGGHNVGLKERHRVFQTDRMRGGRARRATCLVNNGEKRITQPSEKGSRGE